MNRLSGAYGLFPVRTKYQRQDRSTKENALLSKHTFPTVDMYTAACLVGHAEAPRTSSQVVCGLSAQQWPP